MITKLRVQNFRPHKDKEIVFVHGTTIVTGPNGSGKTSLIEAVYITLQGKSWRSHFDDILTITDKDKNNDWWRIDLEFSDGEKRTVKYQSGAKTFVINESSFTRLPAKKKRPVILFEPNDLLLIYGSPARRRNFFDRFITQIEPGYAATLRKFERVLSQRNNLLRRGTTRDELFVWDMQFVSLAEKITASREMWVKRINEYIGEHYGNIAGNKDAVAVSYIAPQKTVQGLLDHLNRDFEQGYPYTRTGPQTHDIAFTLNGRDAKQTASRGENRTILFATLGAMTELFNTLLGEKAYLIFDDVDSELDKDRRARLYGLKIFTENYLIATTIHHTKGFSNWIPLD